MKYWYRFYYGLLELLGYKSCEECNEWSKNDVYDYNLCGKCYEHLICECGQRLEDSYGTPGDGFCIKCR